MKGGDSLINRIEDFARYQAGPNRNLTYEQRESAAIEEQKTAYATEVQNLLNDCQNELTEQQISNIKDKLAHTQGLKAIVRRNREKMQNIFRIPGIPVMPAGSSGPIPRPILNPVIK